MAIADKSYMDLMIISGKQVYLDVDLDAKKFYPFIRKGFWSGKA